MKKFKRLFAAALIMFCITTLSAQTAPPPNNGNGDPTGGGHIPVGGAAAPIGGGLFVLLGLGIVYSSAKIYNNRKRILD